MQTLHQKGILDFTGAAISWVCAIHCLAMPFLITALPLVGLGFLADETTELIIIAISVAIALFSFLPSFKRHRKPDPLILFCFGIVFIGSSHLFFEETYYFKLPLILFGAFLVSISHLINSIHCKNCRNSRIEIR